MLFLVSLVQCNYRIWFYFFKFYSFKDAIGIKDVSRRNQIRELKKKWFYRKDEVVFLVGYAGSYGYFRKWGSRQISHLSSISLIYYEHTLNSWLPSFRDGWLTGSAISRKRFFQHKSGEKSWDYSYTEKYNIKKLYIFWKQIVKILNWRDVLNLKESGNSQKVRKLKCRKT